MLLLHAFIVNSSQFTVKLALSIAFNFIQPLTPALSSCWGDTVELRQCRSNFKTYNENQEKVKVLLLPKQIKPEARFKFFFPSEEKYFSSVQNI